MEKRLFWFHVFSLNSSDSQAEWLLLSWGAERSLGAIPTSLGKCPRASPGGDPGQGTRAQCQPKAAWKGALRQPTFRMGQASVVRGQENRVRESR